MSSTTPYGERAAAPRRAGAPTLAGLLVALFGPPAVAIVSMRAVGTSTGVALPLLFQLGLWVLLALVLLIVVRWERRPVASIGLLKPRVATFVWALALALGLIFVVSPVTIGVASRVGIPLFGEGLRPLLALPVGYRIFAAVTAGVVEETLYRGYAIERLSELTGNVWAGAILAVLTFALAHTPSWGLGPALLTLAAGAIHAIVYVWRRDVLVNILAHAGANVVGLVIWPPEASL